MDLKLIDFDISPIVNNYNNYSDFTNLVLIDSFVNQNEVFYESTNNYTLPIKYNYYTNKEKMLGYLIDNNVKKINRLCFVFDNAQMDNKLFLDNETFFNDNDLLIFKNGEKNIEKYSKNLAFIINLINNLNIKNIDFLACDSLKYLNWVEYYNILFTLTGAKIGASNDLTGNIFYGGNWVMENTQEDIKNIYFNSNIINYSDVLISKSLTHSLATHYGRHIFNMEFKNTNENRIITIDKFSNLWFYFPSRSKNYLVYYREKGNSSYIFCKDNDNLNILMRPNIIYEIMLIFESQQNIVFGFHGKPENSILVSNEDLIMYTGTNHFGHFIFNSYNDFLNFNPNKDYIGVNMYQLYCSVNYSYYYTLPISNICFPKLTPIYTDQGLINIENINVNHNTINNKKIIAITKTITEESHLICIEKNAIYKNVTNQKTIISINHKLFYKRKMVSASELLDIGLSVYKIPYKGEILYNVLMENHNKMRVNNLICETLNPKNRIAQLYLLLQKYSNELHNYVINSYNKKYVKKY